MDETIEIFGEFDVLTYGLARVRDAYPGFSDYKPAKKLAILRGFRPDSQHHAVNTTCLNLHELLVDHLDASQSITAPIGQLALGRDGSTPASSDTSLGDEVDRLDVTEYTDNGTSIQTRTFIPEGAANVDASAGEALQEAGLYAGGGSYFLNHGTFSTPIEKDNTTTATVTATLSFSSA